MATLTSEDIRERLVTLDELGLARDEFLSSAKRREISTVADTALKSGKIILDPKPDLEAALGPITVDARLGNLIEMVNIPLEIANVDGRTVVRQHVVWYGNQPAKLLRNDHDRQFEVIDNGARVRFRLNKGEFFQFPQKILITPYTLEIVAVPYDLEMHLEGRSSLARTGIATHVTSPRFDPGFIGLMTLEMINVGPLDVCIQQGERVVALSFSQLTSQARPYFSIPGEGGRFAGQG
jgi:dCTP deaminase